MKITNNTLNIPRQRGAVLFVALVFLVLVTLLAITASSTSILQERMTGGMRNQQLGMMGSESALRGAEATIWNLAYNSNGTLAMPPCDGTSTNIECVYKIQGATLSPAVQSFRTSKTWLDTSSDGATNYAGAVTGLTATNATASLATVPRVIIEDLGPDVPPGPNRRGGSNKQEKPGSPGSHEWYRITSRSQGGSDAVVRVTESVFSALAPASAGIVSP